MSTLLKVRGIRASKYKSEEFTALLFYFLRKNNTGQLVYTSLTCKIHLVKHLKANLLIGNVIKPQDSFVIDVKGKNALIRSCKMIVSIDIKQKRRFFTRKLLASQETVVFPYSEAMVLLLPLLLTNNCDFIFYPTTQANLTLFTYIINYQTFKILVENISNLSFCILWCYKLGHLIDIAYDNCFLNNTQIVLDAAILPALLY